VAQQTNTKWKGLGGLPEDKTKSYEILVGSLKKREIVRDLRVNGRMT
jgi:hypothetical protein